MDHPFDQTIFVYKNTDSFYEAHDPKEIFALQRDGDIPPNDALLCYFPPHSNITFEQLDSYQFKANPIICMIDANGAHRTLRYPTTQRMISELKELKSQVINFNDIAIYDLASGEDPSSIEPDKKENEGVFFDKDLIEIVDELGVILRWESSEWKGNHRVGWQILNAIVKVKEQGTKGLRDHIKNTLNY